MLTRREFKGYCHEIDTQWLLTAYGVKYEANPIDPTEWKRTNNRHKTDITVKRVKGITITDGLQIEAKHIDGMVYPSWYKRDWETKGNCIFVYNGDLKLSKSIKHKPILIHSSLLPAYLFYNPYARMLKVNGVTSLFKAKLYKSINVNVVASSFGVFNIVHSSTESVKNIQQLAYKLHSQYLRLKLLDSHHFGYR